MLPQPICFLWETNDYWQKFLNIKLPHIGVTNIIFTWYLIGISLIAFLILLTSLIVILLWPVERYFNLIHRHNGQVKVMSKAINSYVKTSLADLPYLNNIKVSSKLTKHRLQIKVSGTLSAGENVSASLNDYLDETNKGLKQLLGIEQKPKIIIKFINYNKTDKTNQLS